jgi:hypothetical protein
MSKRASDWKDFVNEIRTKQQNLTWPEMVRNGRAVDEFFWKGSANAPPVQRIAACLFGLCFSVGGLEFLGFALKHRSLFLLLLAAGLILLGGRLLMNGLVRRKR